MALEVTGDFQLSAPLESVWEKLNDPDVLKACIPGCEELKKLPDGGFPASKRGVKTPPSSSSALPPEGGKGVMEIPIYPGRG